MVLIHNKQALLSPHNAAPNHNPHERLHECWYEMAVKELFNGSVCDIDATPFVTKINVTSIQPYYFCTLLCPQLILALLCCFVRYGTFRATHPWYPASVETLHTIPSLTFGSTWFLILEIGVQHAFTAV
jgi:hypothetical protein